MIQQKTVTIGTDTYMITHMPATRGVRTMKQLAKLLGPALPAYQSGSMVTAIGALLENLDNVDVENLLKELISTVSKNNMGINYDMEFAGKYDTLFKLAQEVVEFNFGSVFTLLGSEDQVL